MTFKKPGETIPAIPLRWVKNDVEAAKTFFGPGRTTPALTYSGAPIEADFPLTYEALAPYVHEILNQAAPIEAAEGFVGLVEIKNGLVQVSPAAT